MGGGTSFAEWRHLDEGKRVIPALDVLIIFNIHGERPVYGLLYFQLLNDYTEYC